MRRYDTNVLLPCCIKNTQSFIEEAKIWNIEKNEFQVSYDVEILYPSIPVKEATEALVDQLNKDNDLKKYMSMKPKRDQRFLRGCIIFCIYTPVKRL